MENTTTTRWAIRQHTSYGTNRATDGYYGPSDRLGSIEQQAATHPEALELLYATEADAVRDLRDKFRSLADRERGDTIWLELTEGEHAPDRSEVDGPLMVLYPNGTSFSYDTTSWDVVAIQVPTLAD